MNDYPNPAFAFSVEIAGCVSAGEASCREVLGSRAAMELEAVVEGGENSFVHQLPRGVRQGRLVLKRGLVKRDSQLIDWCIQVLEQELDKPIQPRRVKVSLLDETRNPLRAWVFLNAYPVLWEVEPFHASRNDVAIERIELAYQSAKTYVRGSANGALVHGH